MPDLIYFPGANSFDIAKTGCLFSTNLSDELVVPYHYLMQYIEVELWSGESKRPELGNGHRLATSHTLHDVCTERDPGSTKFFFVGKNTLQN
jgi:hypothetical protein